MYRKPIFETVKVLLARGFDQFEVESLDRLSELTDASVQWAEAIKARNGDLAALPKQLAQIALYEG